MRTRKTTQRVICLLLIVAMTCTGLPVSVFGETAQETMVPEITKTMDAAETQTEPTATPQETPQETPPEIPQESPEEEEPNTVVETAPEQAPEPVKETMKQGWVTNEDGTWSFYDEKGEKTTGWQFVGGKWYYMKPETGIAASAETMDIDGKKYRFRKSCEMVRNWVLEDGVWYYANGSGHLYLGWKMYNNEWYYMDEKTGAMCVNQWVDNDRYYMNAVGHISTGWVLDQETGAWYYMNKSGLAAPGWLRYSGQWYYIQNNGLMTTSAWVYVGGAWYYMKDNGYMTTGWLHVDNTWYYLKSGGNMATGWLKLGNTWYYLNGSGAMATGWLKLGNTWYYLNSSGAMATGWQYVFGNWYYLNGSGAMATGWLKLGNTWYYLNGSGAMATGWVGEYYMTGSGAMMTNNVVQNSGIWYYVGASGKKEGTGWKKVGDVWYYVNSDHSCATGWKKVGASWYYLDPATAIMKTGWLQIGSTYYYINGSGAMATGWQYVFGKWYYLNGSGAMATGWVDVSGKRYYLSGSGAMMTGWQQIDSLWYYFYGDGSMARNTTIGVYYVNSEGVWKQTSAGATDPGTLKFKDVAPGGKTIKNLLQNAMKPVANTLYVWGGGWDSEIGGDARRIGTNPQWKTFYTTYAGHYDYNNYRYSYKNGLDCSGYVGWAIYNTINTQSNKSSVTVQSTTVANYLVNTKGWGEPSMLKNPTVFRPGDICSMDGHVYMVVGTCSDGSVVILHSTPQAGVQLSGSPVLSTGSQNSQAYALAKKYNEKYFPNWEYNTRCVGVGYFSGITRCRWKVDGSGILTDPDKYLNLSANQVLANLFGE